MKKINELFGSNVFNESIMKERLPKETFKSLMKTIDEGAPLDETVAQVVANAMKDWAIEKGATHFTHWFQPMTGITAEKHDAFISPSVEGKIIMEFSGKELILGEPDASSFPSGGLRATFEARGYTAWDPTSYAFVKDDSLCIPTAFCSYSGEVLDKKTPLLRSMEAINKEALKVLKPEQEYFLIDEETYKQRKDLIFTGRTLFGAMPPKGQELEDHYFGSIKERVSAYMKELDEELWKLGVHAKTKHNEVAPGQHELAPIYSTTNIATDHNQLTMDLMKKIAKRHGLVCLLHEKPFAGVNGSGKHNNWSLGTTSGENLLKPGEDPIHNKQFLFFLSAIIDAVDTYGDLLRVSVATAGNDHRLGANEAPPAIVSMFLGEELTNVLEAIEAGKTSLDKIRGIVVTGVDSLPTINKDTTDRNRTSPFAFTGNKFEFRMPGSSQSIAGINITINTIVAESLRKFANILEKADDFDLCVESLVKETIKEHKRIIFNGNNYSEDWVIEAKKRGLPNLRSTVEALPSFIAPKNIEVFTKHGIFSEAEIHSRYEILLEDYTKAINIEALTMIDMANKEILPACIEYSTELLNSLALKKASGLNLATVREEAFVTKVSNLTESLIEKIDILQISNIKAKEITNALDLAKYYRDTVFIAMGELRTVADALEEIVSTLYWPYPTYSDLLFNV
ncbi:MAG: Glutamine synthetase type protein [Clostridiales bacterium]|nr:Glutamine synthetase type protein [Clostridiales bacterium]